MHAHLKFSLVFFTAASLSLFGCGGGGGGGGGDTPPPANAALKANAGADEKIRIVSPTTVVPLNGSGSTGPEGRTYTWTALNGGLLTGSGATPTFTVTKPGVYPVSLVVSDGVNTSTDVMTVTVYDTIQTTTRNLGLNAIAIEGATDGGFYVLGTVDETTDSPLKDILIQRIDANGDPLGHKRIGRLNFRDFPADLIELQPGIVAIVGTVEETGNPLSGDVYLAVVDLNGPGEGTILIEETIHREGHDVGASIRITDNNDLLISGSSGTGAARVMRFIRLSVDLITLAQPVVAWDITIDAPGTNDFGVDAFAESETQVVVLGISATTTRNIYLARVNPFNLSITDENTIDGGGTDVALALERIPAAGYLVVGSTDSFGWGYDILAIQTGLDLKLSDPLSDLSDYAIGGGNDDFSVYARKVTASDTGFLITGATEPVDNDFYAVLLTLDLEGNKIDQGVYGFDGDSDEVGLFARELPLATYQLAGISGILNFANLTNSTNPTEFSVSSGLFFQVMVDKSTMLVR